MEILLNVNGRDYPVLVQPDAWLLETLRSLGFTSVKKGCDQTSCGVCTVLLDGLPVPACSVLSVRAHGHGITTVEGIYEEAEIFADLIGHYGGDQCGFCNPSLALAVYAMKQELLGLEHLTSDQNVAVWQAGFDVDAYIRHYLVAHLCRCTGYVRQHMAIKAYLEVRA